MKVFNPFKTHWSPSRTAFAWVPPASEPPREAPAASVPRVRAAARTVAPPPAVSQPLPERAMAETIELPTRGYEPPEPDLIERGFAAARNWLLGGNTMSSKMNFTMPFS